MGAGDVCVALKRVEESVALGDFAAARRELSQLLRLKASPSPDPRIIARAYIGVGDYGRAISLLEQAYAQHSIEITSLKVNPEFDPLRNDPRFQ